MSSTRGFWRKKSRDGLIWYTRHPATGKAISTGCRDIGAAKLYRARLERENADPHHAPAPPETLQLDAVAARFIADRERAGRADATVKIHRCKIGHALRLLGMQADTRRFTADTITAFIDQRLKEGAHRHTVFKELVSLRCALKLVRGKLPYRVEDIFPSFSASYVPRELALTKEQFAKLIAATAPLRRADVAYLACTGVRAGELKRARCEDITFDEVWIRGTKTTDAPRMLPLLGELLGVLLTRGPRSSSRLFDKWTNMNRDIAAAAKRAGLPHVTPNDLRRTFCTWMRDDGVDEAVCGAFLGHSGSAMVRKVYGRTTSAAKRRAVEALKPVGVDLAAFRLDEQLAVWAAANGVRWAANLGHVVPGVASTVATLLPLDGLAGLPGRQNLSNLVSPAGFEPATNGLKGPASPAGEASNRAPLRLVPADGEASTVACVCPTCGQSWDGVARSARE